MKKAVFQDEHSTEMRAFYNADGNPIILLKYLDETLAYVFKDHLEVKEFIKELSLIIR